VLSFPQNDPNLLGDVVISLETASKQAEEFGHSLQDEVERLLAHGLLHLLGYDHETPEDEKLMKAKEDAALDAVKQP
jgi:probable rRNA maturation factor